MNHQIVYSVIAAIVFAFVAFFVVRAIKSRLVKSRRTFRLTDKSGINVAFVLGEEDDFGEVVDEHIKKLERKGMNNHSNPATAAGNFQ